MAHVDLPHLHASLATLKATAKYAPGTVAWNDGDRGVLPNGQLSCFGSNTTDVKLMGKTPGQVFPYLKPHNYDEHLGVTTADKVVVGVEDGVPVTAQQVLETLDARAKASGFAKATMAVQPRHPVVVRVQNAFVPFAPDQTIEQVVCKHYSYQTFDKTKPRNLLVCGHKGGVDVQADAPGENPLYSLERKPDGSVATHYFTVTPTEHAVGTAQTTGDGGETQPPELGLKGMGPRGNAFVVMSLSNKAPPPQPRGLAFSTTGWDTGGVVYRSLGASCEGQASAAALGVDDEDMGAYDSGGASIEVDPDACVMITIVLYNVLLKPDTAAKDALVALPLQDVAMAVGDMDKAYGLCEAQGRLSELPDMLVRMTKGMMDVVERKLKEDPPEPAAPPAKKTHGFAANAAAALVGLA